MPYLNLNDEIENRKEYYKTHKEKMKENRRIREIKYKQILTEYYRRRYLRDRKLRMSYNIKNRISKIEYYRQYEKIRYARDHDKRLKCHRMYRLRKKIFGMFKK